MVISRRGLATALQRIPIGSGLGRLTVRIIGLPKLATIWLPQVMKFAIANRDVSDSCSRPGVFPTRRDR
jgi:hypothetical protein